MHEGRPLIVSVIERFAPQVGPLLISANRNVERYAALGTVVEDDTADCEWRTLRRTFDRRTQRLASRAHRMGCDRSLRCASSAAQPGAASGERRIE